MLKKLKNIFKNEKDSADNSNTIEPSQNVNISPYWRSGDIRIKLDRPAVKHFERYRFAADFLNSMNCRDICDIACGSGYGSWILSGFGMKSTGMDIEEDVIV